jgi:hypothetical protein
MASKKCAGTYGTGLARILMDMRHQSPPSRMVFHAEEHRLFCVHTLVHGSSANKVKCSSWSGMQRKVL